MVSTENQPRGQWQVQLQQIHSLAHTWSQLQTSPGFFFSSEAFKKKSDGGEGEGAAGRYQGLIPVVVICSIQIQILFFFYL